MLAMTGYMRGWLASLAERRCLPVLGGFAQLDIQIEKFRFLKESYTLANKEITSKYGQRIESCTQ